MCNKGAEHGNLVWFIPDCYYPQYSSGRFPSHEAVCVLNTGKQDASLSLTLYFEDREPIHRFKAGCKAERTNHIRLDKIKDDSGNVIPQGVPYALMVESNVPVIIQYSRMDTTQAEMALMSAMAYPVR